MSCQPGSFIEDPWVIYHFDFEHVNQPWEIRWSVVLGVGPFAWRRTNVRYAASPCFPWQLTKPTCTLFRIFIVIIFPSSQTCYLPPPPKVKEVIFSPLSVCLCTEYLKKLWMDPDEIFWTCSVCDMDKLIRFWWRSGSGYDFQNFLSDSSPLRDRAKNDI